MGRHSRQKRFKPVPTAVLGLTVLSATGPIALMALAPTVADAKGTLVETTQEMPVLIPRQVLALPTSETTTSTKTTKKNEKLDKDGNPVERTRAVPVMTTTTKPRPTLAERQVARSKTTPRTTTPKPTTTSPVPTRTRVTTSPTPRPTPKPSITTRTTTNPPVSTRTTTSSLTTPPVSSGRTAGLGLAPSAARATEDILAATGFTGTIYGRGSRPNNPTSDHPRGYAVDFMTSNLAVGNAIKKYALDNQTRLGVKYVIWQEPAHYDHVHISFVG